MTGAMFMAHCLQQEGVTKVFGQCGHTNYALIDACHKLGIEYISFRHEQQAAHAADAYYRVSHKLAVLNVHLSPGLTNALTGVASAAADSHADGGHHRQHAVVSPRARAASGHPAPRRRVAGRHLPSDLQARLARRRCEVPDRRDAARAERRADRAIRARCCSTSRWTSSRSTSSRRRRRCRAAGPNYAAPAGAPDGIADAVQLLQAAKPPAIFAGNGVLLSEASDELKALAELMAMPVATTLMAKGAFPEDHPLALGMTGIWGTRVANETMRGADVVLAIGTAFGEADCSSWRPEHTFAIPPTRLIQIDIDPQEIGKIYPVDVGIVGDAKTVLRS